VTYSSGGGTEKKSSDARAVPSLLRRLTAGLHNPRFVLTLGACCLGAAILVANDAAIRKGNVAATKTAEQYTETLSRALRDQLDARLAAVEGLARLVGAEAQRDGLELAALRMARMVAGKSGKFAEFSLFDASGGKIWESQMMEIPASVLTEHFTAHRQDGPRLHVSPAGRQGNSPNWIFHLSYPATGRDGKLLGLTMVSVNVARLQQIRGEMNLGAGSTLALLRRDGTLIAHVSDGDPVAGQDLSRDAWVGPALQVSRDCRTGLMTSPMDGMERVSSFCAMENHPLLAGVGISAGAAMAASQSTAMRYRIIAGLLVGLLGLGTLVLLVLLGRQQATQVALRNSETRFKALSALGSDWYWEADAEYRITQISEGFLRMSGRATEEMLGKVRWDNSFITPVGSDWAAHKAVIARCAPFRGLILRYTSPQGVVAYGSLNGEPIFDDDNTLLGYRGVGNDITAEIVLRQQLRMQHDVARILSQEKDQKRAMQQVIETICRTMEWSWGARRHIDPATSMLTCHEYWLAPGINASSFVEFARAPRMANMKTGTVSLAVSRNEIVWYTDFTQQSERRRYFAEEAGLRGAVAVPIRRSRDTEDALEFFSARVEAPDQVMLDTLEVISREVGQYMDRDEAQQASTYLERERRHLLDMLELQLEHMPVACLLQDENFLVVYCNPAAERIFGYSAAELRGRDTAELIVPEALRPLVLERRARLQAKDMHVTGSNENIRKDGRRIICEWSNTPLTDESGKFTGVLAIAQDVTERMKMVEALEASEERYRRIFAATPLPMWVTEIHTPYFLAVNDAAVEKYGYTREEFQAMSALDLQAEEDRDLVKQQLLGRDPSLPAHFVRRHVTKSGQIITVEITAQPFQFGGRDARLILAMDITDRQRVQQAMEESEARFRAVFEQASVGIAIRDLSDEPRFLRVNRKLCEILGYSENELLQKTTRELTADEDLDAAREMGGRLLSGDTKGYSRRKRYKHKNGKNVWVNLSVSRFDEGSGSKKTPYLISVIADISEQVESEARVMESEARYRQIFALTPLPMYLRHEDKLNFIDVNDACLGMYGYTRQKMLSMNLLDIQTPADRERYLAGAGQRPGGIVERLQKQHVRSNGEVVDVEIYSYPTMLAGEKVRLVLLRDMTDQLRMERLLRDNESRLRAIADNVPAVIAFFDDRQQLQYSNIAFDRWFGAARLDVRGGVLRVEQDVSQYRETLGPLLAQALRGDEVVTERTLDTQSGARVARLTLIPHVADDGAVAGVHLMGYDLTDFRLAEAEVRHLNAELEQRVEQRTRALAAANRELESFSYSVSHDLRAPLRTIDGFSQILLDEYASKLDATGRSYLDRVRAGSQRMAKLIDDLLELARVTRRDPQIRDCDLTALALDISTELAAADPERKVSIKVAPGMVVAADTGLLRIALDNLLRNAWKFTSLKSDAVIEVGCVEAADGRTYFVRDNGVGFDMAYVNKLFGAFQRLHSESEFQGTGIGLALVQRVIRRHGGQVWAEAETDLGATFYFTLPLQVVLPAEPAEQLREAT
jgi:PAS domain S-box-containing protein